MIIISEGQIKLDDTLEHIEFSHKGKLRIEVIFEGHIHPDAIREKFPEIVDLLLYGQKMEIVSSQDIRKELLVFLVAHYKIVEFFSEKISLSDVFFETIK